jgi:hypothetical protein
MLTDKIWANFGKLHKTKNTGLQAKHIFSNPTPAHFHNRLLIQQWSPSIGIEGRIYSSMTVQPAVTTGMS